MIWGEMVSPQFAIFARVNGNPRTPRVKQLRTLIGVDASLIDGGDFIFT